MIRRFPAPPGVIYGSGADGAVVVSSNRTLDAEINARTLVVNAGATLFTNGFAVRATSSILNNGTISSDGSAPSGITAGGYSPPVQGTLGFGTPGGDGSSQGSGAQAGTWLGIGGRGGSGGNGGQGAPGQPGGEGGVAPGITGTSSRTSSPVAAIVGAFSFQGSGLIAVPGGCGGGGGGATLNARGGGGGGGGAPMLLSAPRIVNKSVITARGANGAAGGSAGLGGGQGGGGGGGGGGFVVTVGRYFGDAPVVSGGLGGAGYNGGAAGQPGSLGAVESFST